MTPKPANVRFYPTAAAAQAAGFRACKRCRPDATPGSPEWNARADLVGRAMRLIADGVVDREGVAGSRSRLGYSERHLHRQLVAEVGAGPLALARAQRAQTARVLIETTDLPLRRRRVRRRLREHPPVQRHRSARSSPTTPSDLRTRSPAATSRAPGAHRRCGCPAAAPFDGDAVRRVPRPRAVPGIEEVERRRPTGARCACPTARGVRRADARSPTTCRAVLRLDDLRDLTAAVQRCRRLFDLDADPLAVDEQLGADPHPRSPLVAKTPGLRVAGHRRRLRARDARRARPAGLALPAPARWPLGSSPPTASRSRPPTAASPTCSRTAEAIASSPPGALRMPAARRAVLAGAGDRDRRTARSSLDAGADRAATTAGLLDIRGVGPWTASLHGDARPRRSRRVPRRPTSACATRSNALDLPTSAKRRRRRSRSAGARGAPTPSCTFGGRCDEDGKHRDDGDAVRSVHDRDGRRRRHRERLDDEHRRAHGDGVFVAPPDDDHRAAPSSAR